ncbi:GGDEF domain-containing response regulator [Aliamphritea spongicola]|uniref:GGDEF domain-containing response regulator n=1 Tax=Aliamphritea spongicola TaxID=707589 RepID=UPI00196A46F3|nr:diguanylate cyclase [Aliamphritea spongicola]MBN3561749.1 diguanylate cyclase [Aliamphritea spongicola]
MQILVVDDTKLVRDLLESIILDAGDTPFLANGAKEAKTILNTVDIDLILMDVEMPKMDGFTLTRQIRRHLGDNWIPIIFLTGKSDDQHLADAIDAGGDDYLTKPINPIVLGAKIRAMARIAQMKADLEEANHQLMKLTHLDPLTETVNRRGLEESLQREWKLHQREKTELCVMFIDIDQFKPYNDNYGHPQGDVCLKEFGAVLKQQLRRPADLVARYGGEEFVILLPNTELAGAEKIASDIIHALEQAALEHAYSSVKPYVTASIGISTSAFSPNSSQALLSQADKALYFAKSNGRNRYATFADIEAETAKQA